MVTWIGKDDSKIVVSDNATPSSGTYAWGCVMDKPVKGHLPFAPMTQIITTGGKNERIEQLKLEGSCKLGLLLENNTDWQNWLKSLGTWKKNKTKLFLSIKNEWDSNLMLIPDATTPTTLNQWTGGVENFLFTLLPNTNQVEFAFVIAITFTS